MGPIEYVSEGILTDVYEPNDVFRSRPIDKDEIDLDKFEHVETLFCDSSGFGQPGEPALTRAQTIARVSELIEEHGDLVSAITDMGQFQVYLSLYKRAD